MTTPVRSALYDEPMVGLDYEGAHHSAERTKYVHDIGRAELIDRRGWIDVKVVAEHGRAFILYRLREAFARRGWTPPPTKSAIRRDRRQPWCGSRGY